MFQIIIPPSLLVVRVVFEDDEALHDGSER